MTTDEYTTVVNAVLDAREARDSGIRQTAERFDSLKKIGGAVVFFAALVVGGVVTFQELQDKPTDAEVTKAIETHREAGAHPASVTNVTAIKSDITDIKKDLDRVEKVQDYALQNAAWQGEVLDHIAQKKKGKPKAKPQTLKDTERDLLRGTR